MATGSAVKGGGRWRALMWGGAACLLLLPLVAMQFSDEVRWTGGDFFFGVVGPAMAGARVARGRPQGMAIAMAATAAAMAAVAIVILATGWNTEAWVLSASFVAPWLASAALFRKTAVDDSVEIGHARSSSS